MGNAAKYTPSPEVQQAMGVAAQLRTAARGDEFDRLVAAATIVEEPRAIFWWRCSEGLSQQQLGDRCGLSQSGVSKVESGIRRLSPMTARRVVDVFAGGDR